MSNAKDVINCTKDWAKDQNSPGISEYYLFGSAIYKEGVQFDYKKYDSDLDIVVLLRNDLTTLERRDEIVAFRDCKYQLELRLLPVLKVQRIDKPIVSAIPVSSFELACDIHKTISDGFFSKNDFLNLRSGNTSNFELEKQIDLNSRERLLIPAIQACQKYRNEYLAITANRLPSISPHDNADVLPKGLSRVAAAVSHYVKPRDGVSEHDINEGTTFIFRLVEEFEDQQSEIWGTLRQIIQERMSRGDTAIAPEDVLLLHELLRDKAVSLLTTALERKERPGKAGQSTILSIKSEQNNGQKLEVNLYLMDQPVPAGDIVKVVGATRDFFKALGFDQISEDDPKFGSFMMDLVFFAREFDAAELIAKTLKTHISSGSSDSQVGVRNFKLTHKQAEATTRLLDAIEGLNELVLRMGSIVIIKTLVDGNPRIHLHQLAEDEISFINKQPDLMKSPAALYRLLTESESSSSGLTQT